MRKIAIIPARSGSKGLKDKNIIDLCGKPLMAYTIEAAVESHAFEQIILSTDSQKYGSIGRKYGAEVIYRDAILSNDQASTYMVIEDILKRLNQKDTQYDYFVLLQPTSPMRTFKHIKDAIGLFENNIEKYDFLVSVKRAEHAKVLTNPIDQDGSMKYFDADFSAYRRQSYTDFTPNGAIFIGKISRYLEKKHFYGAKSLAYIMSKFDSVDIDDRIDYEMARLCMAAQMRGERI